MTSRALLEAFLIKLAWQIAFLCLIIFVIYMTCPAQDVL